MQLGTGVLGIEDAPERGRARSVLRARKLGPARRRGAARATRPSPAERTRLLRRARGARDARTGERPLPQHGRDGSLSRPRQAQLRGRPARDAERPAVRVLELAHGGPAHRRAAERGKDGRKPVRGDLLRPGPAARIRQGDDRQQPRAGAGDGRDVSLGPVQDRDRHRLRGGLRPGPGCARARAHERRRLRPAGGRAAVRRVRGRRPGSAIGWTSTRATSSPTSCQAPTSW